jgi:DNA-binding LytR/AlgR family response regulator
MHKMNGIEFLKSSTSLPMVIMTTAYGQYALDGFELAVVDYLVKPFSLDRFIKAAQKALEVKKLKLKSISTDQDTNNHFFVKCDGRIERILYKDLLYIEAMTNYITLYTADGKLVVYLTIKGILEKLPVNKFVQVHKSYVVNVEHFKTIEGNMLHVGDNKITVSLSYNDDVMKRVLKDKFIKR